jgi:putative endonuclease
MWYVYLLQSVTRADKTYVGMTDDVEARVRKHNDSATKYTATHRPWELIGYIAVKDKAKAAALERYLKAGSGHAWAHKHLW